MAIGFALFVASLYSALLFWLAHAADKGRFDRLLEGKAGWIYGLSLGVYCTSWTFYGAVGTAAQDGLQFLPIYLGPILLYVFGRPLLQRILTIGKAQHSTSIADFLSARYGKSSGVAAAVTFTALFGALPYMTLQLKSVSQTMAALAPEISHALRTDQLVLVVAVVMAVFAILFGTRRLDLAQKNRGLVLAIALEAVIKLAALLAVAAFALVLITGSSHIPDLAPSRQHIFSWNQVDARFFTMTMVGAFAVICLPRQFHMAVVEASDARLSGVRWWLFPAYLLLTALSVIPVVIAGNLLLPANAEADMLMLSLPLAFNADWLAILAFIGGFSASTGMIIVTSVALSGMITNDIILPLFVSGKNMGNRSFDGRSLLLVRRLIIASLLALAYFYYLLVDSGATLASLGQIAFAASAQFAPPLLLGLIWRKGHRAGAIAGIVAGFICWFFLLFVPAFDSALLPFQINDDALVSGIVISLSLNVLCYFLISLAVESNLQDRVQASAYVDGQGVAGRRASLSTRAHVADLRLMVEQFIGPLRTRQSVNQLRLTSGKPYADTDRPDDALLAMCENLLAGVLGSSSANALVQSTLEGDPLPIERVVAMFDVTSQRLQFGEELLQTAIQNIDQGVSVVNHDLQLVAWNRRYIEIFSYPDELIETGRPIEQLIRYNLKRLGVADAQLEREVAKRIAHLRAGRRHSGETTMPDGRVLRILGNAAPNQGYVTSYSDITVDRETEQALEAKVAQRTQQLTEANQALEKATRSKTRFLAAASHDLVQPMNAARLFAGALAGEIDESHVEERQLLAKIDRSISTANRLLRALLDISKLDGGGLQATNARFALATCFAEIGNEFQEQAAAKGLMLKLLPTSIWLNSDRAFLTSILQNLVTNAVRYSEKGRILVGAKRCGGGVEIFVIDEGVGIKANQQSHIFDEFTRLQPAYAEEGLGLGLAIVQRIAGLLGTSVKLASAEGKGSSFSFILERAEPESLPPALIARSPSSDTQMTQKQVLCVDDDADGLSALAALLTRWGLVVETAEDAAAALRHAQPDLLIMDYQLQNGMTGDALFAQLVQAWGAAPPTILFTAQDTADSAAAAQKMGAVRLGKSPSPAVLRALVNRMLS